MQAAAEHNSHTVERNSLPSEAATTATAATAEDTVNNDNSNAPSQPTTATAATSNKQQKKNSWPGRKKASSGSKRAREEGGGNGGGEGAQVAAHKPKFCPGGCGRYVLAYSRHCAGCGWRRPTKPHDHFRLCPGCNQRIGRATVVHAACGWRKEGHVKKPRVITKPCPSASCRKVGHRIHNKVAACDRCGLVMRPECDSTAALLRRQSDTTRKKKRTQQQQASQSNPTTATETTTLALVPALQPEVLPRSLPPLRHCTRPQQQRPPAEAAVQLAAYSDSGLLPTSLLEASVRRLPHHNGPQLAYRVCGAIALDLLDEANRDLETSNVTVMFCPGFRSTMMDAKAQALATWAEVTGRRCVLFDYSGHGESLGQFLEGSATQWLEDLLSVMQAAAPGRVVLIGDGMGAWLALLAAQRAPAAVVGIVGIASAPDFTEDFIWNQLSDAERRTLQEQGLIWYTRYGLDPFPCSLRLILDARQHLLLRSDRRLLVKCPVRLLHGMEDQEVPWQHSLRLLNTLDAADSSVTLVKGADHHFLRTEDLSHITSALEAILVTIN